MAKAIIWTRTDSEVRKRGEQTGLETPVVHALNDECFLLEVKSRSKEANALSIPPGEYDRKVETQKN